MALTTAEAAHRLGVSAHEVRRLIGAGDLRAQMKGRIWLIDDDSVDDRAQFSLSRGRALAAHTAWAALLEASGEKAGWLDVHTRSRLRKWLRQQDAVSLAATCRRRADRHTLRILPAYRDRVLDTDGVIQSGVGVAAEAGADLVVVGTAVAEIYCTEQTLTALTKRFKLSAAGEANLVVRVPRWQGRNLLSRRVMPAAVVAVDLMEAVDSRTRRAGKQLLTELLRSNSRHT